MLLFDFLSEVVYFKDAERLLFSKFEVEIVDSNLRGKFCGEEIRLKNSKRTIR